MKRSSRLSPRIALLLPLLLTGCVLDSASYIIDVKDHAVTVTRNQSWFWEDTLTLNISIIRLPECGGGGSIAGVRRDAEPVLSRAPDEYAEPLLILRAGDRHYAISTQSCRMQAFEQAPEDPGAELGRFIEKHGEFRFEPAAAPADAG